MRKSPHHTGHRLAADRAARSIELLNSEPLVAHLARIDATTDTLLSQANRIRKGELESLDDWDRELQEPQQRADKDVTIGIPEPREQFVLALGGNLDDYSRAYTAARVLAIKWCRKRRTVNNLQGTLGLIENWYTCIRQGLSVEPSLPEGIYWAEFRMRVMSISAAIAVAKC